ncbi:MAG: hypothetical protein ACRD52_10355 [Candidatus Acidiferrales bacterium]
MIRRTRGAGLISPLYFAAAMAAGLALRLYFIFHFPFSSGDTKFYEELARNWLDHGVYGLFVHGQLTSVDMRVPGYPAFLAAIYATLGRARETVRIIQAVLDLGTCWLTALIAARIASPLAARASDGSPGPPAQDGTDASQARCAATVALWLAALCPFTANYTAVVMTEILATFLAMLAILIFLRAVAHAEIDSTIPARDARAKTAFRTALNFLVCGGVIGLDTLVRPESPLLLIAALVFLGIHWRPRANWPKLALASAWMAAGLILVLTPWAARNASTLGRIEFLAPRYAQSNGDFIPRGLFAWTRTWMTRFDQAYLVPWKLGKAPIRIETLPSSAFDSPEERSRVADLLSGYNHGWDMTPGRDHQFAILARERTAHRPLRTYVFIPLARAWMMWFTPRVELLPYARDLWPPREKWRENPAAFLVTLGFGILNFIYAGLALVGVWRWRKNPAVEFLVLVLAVRTAFLTQLQTVEPRYLIVCFPAVLVLGALAWFRPPAKTSKAREAA